MRLAALIAAVLIASSFGGIAMAVDIPELTVQTQWKKYCFNNQKTGFKRLCDTRAEVRTRDGASLLAAVEIIEPESKAKKILRVTFPLGMQVKYGTRLSVRRGDTRQSPYVTCSVAGCMSDYEATSAFFASLKGGQGLLVQAIDREGKPLNVTLSLADFWETYNSAIEQVVDESGESPKPWLDDTLRRDLQPPVR